MAIGEGGTAVLLHKAFPNLEGIGGDGLEKSNSKAARGSPPQPLKASHSLHPLVEAARRGCTRGNTNLTACCSAPFILRYLILSQFTDYLVIFLFVGLLVCFNSKRSLLPSGIERYLM